MVTLTSHSPEDTLALGEAWGREARAGWVIGLSGDLGAGKTVLVRGIARGLGVTTRVHSPTFALVNEYAGGRVPLFHLDLYRLNSSREIVAAGLEDYLTREGVTVIEWAERWFGSGPTAAEARWPSGARRVTIDATGPATREIHYEDSGA